MFRLSATVAAGALVAATTLLAFPFLSAAPAFAADIPVTSPDDDGPDTLRQALAIANTAGGEDVIIIDPTVGTITLSSSLTITDGVTIEGNGTTITRDGSFDMVLIDLAAQGAVELDSLNFEADSSTIGRAVLATSATPDSLTISDSTFTGFNSDTTDIYYADWNNLAVLKEGGAVRLDAGELQVSGSTFDTNFSREGGSAISVGAMTGTSRVTGSTFSNNSTKSIDNRGGALAVETIQADVTFTVESSYFVGNLSAPTYITGFRGIAVGVGTVYGEFVVDSTTFDHQIYQFGDRAPGPISGWSVGIERVADGGTARIVNSTFDEPDIDPQQGNVYVVSVVAVDPSASLTLEHSTVVGSGTLIVGNNRGTSRVSNTIAEGLSAADAIKVQAGIPITLEYSALSTALNKLYVTDVAGNQFAVEDMMLQPLANNGGPTPTMMIGPIGPAVGTGMPVALASEPTLEQRGAGYLRRLGLLDIGAVELPSDLPTLPLDPETPGTPSTPADPPTLASTGVDTSVGFVLASSVLLLGGVLVSASRRRRDERGAA